MKRMAPSGHASTQSVQKRQRPRSSRRPWSSRAMASVGQASTQARQPSGHFDVVEHGQAAEPIGERGRFAGRIGDRPVALPEALANDLEHGRSLGLQVVPAVGEVEALVAQREVGDLLVSQRHRQARSSCGTTGRRPCSAAKRPCGIGQADVADLAAPALDERDDQMLGLQAARRRRESARREAPGAARTTNAHRPLDLQPADVGAGEDVAGRPGRDRNVERSGRCPAGKSWRTSRSTPQARAARPTRPRASAVSRETAPVLLEPRLDRGGVPEQVWRHRRRRGAAASTRSQAICSARGLRPRRTRRRPAGPGRGRSGCRTGRAVMLRKSPRRRPQ